VHYWMKPYDSVLDDSTSPFTKWFPGGMLSGTWLPHWEWERRPGSSYLWQVGYFIKVYVS
jgi:hypothetical protein